MRIVRIGVLSPGSGIISQRNGDPEKVTSIITGIPQSKRLFDSLKINELKE